MVSDIVALGRLGSADPRLSCETGRRLARPSDGWAPLQRPGRTMRRRSSALTAYPLIVISRAVVVLYYSSFPEVGSSNTSSTKILSTRGNKGILAQSKVGTKVDDPSMPISPDREEAPRSRICLPMSMHPRKSGNLHTSVVDRRPTTEGPTPRCVCRTPDLATIVLVDGVVP